MTADQRIIELELKLPEPGKPLGLYCPIKVVNGMAYTAGHGPLQLDGTLITGRVGDSLTQEEGFAAARQVGLAMLASLSHHFDGLGKIKRLVKTYGMVQCTEDFKAIAPVLNGFSELMRDVFGEENGIAARSAVGMYSLPADMAVEVECIFEVEA